jgi:hypothetical protein
VSSIGLFYGGYGAIMIPSLGIVDAFGGYTPEYYNARGFFILSILDLHGFSFQCCHSNHIHSLGCSKYFLPCRKRCLVSEDQILKKMPSD